MKNVAIPPGVVIGYDRDEDARRYPVTESGIVVVGGTRSPTRIGTVTVSDPPARVPADEL